MRLSARYPIGLALEAQRRIAEVARKWTAAYVKDSPCRAGCGHCCYQKVPVMLSEACAIAFRLGDDAAKYRQGTELHKVWGSVRCPFLVNNSCDIYQVRPVVCRLIHAVNGPPCTASAPRNIQGDPKVAQAMARHIDKAFCKQVGIRQPPPMMLIDALIIGREFLDKGPERAAELIAKIEEAHSESP